MQKRGLKECGRCGHPLQATPQIYRRQPDGTWSPVSEIDLSKLAPKPLRQRRKLNRKKAAVVTLLVMAGAALDLWLWRMRVRAARRESQEVVRYLNNPVGRIVPHFEVRYLRSPAGELQVAAQTNLPEGTILDVQVYAGPLLVAVDYPVSVRSGAFQTRPMLERGKPFPAASYQLHVRAAFGKRWQPPSALNVVGSLGQRLEGPQVRRADASSEARLEFSQDFVLSP